MPVASWRLCIFLSYWESLNSSFSCSGFFPSKFWQSQKQSLIVTSSNGKSGFSHVVALLSFFFVGHFFVLIWEKENTKYDHSSTKLPILLLTFLIGKEIVNSAISLLSSSCNSNQTVVCNASNSKLKLPTFPEPGVWEWNKGTPITLWLSSVGECCHYT